MSRFGVESMPDMLALILPAVLVAIFVGVVRGVFDGVREVVNGVIIGGFRRAGKTFGLFQDRWLTSSGIHLRDTDVTETSDAHAGDDGSGRADTSVAVRAPWEVTHLRGRRYQLRNSGATDAYDVRVGAERAVRFDPPVGAATWTAGSGRELLAAGSLQTGHPVLTVKWRDESDAGLRTWSMPLQT
jgi:hypothetical protein